jgi:hypothetical protein
MNMPGFTAEAATCSPAILVRGKGLHANRPSAGAVAMAGYYHCHDCPLGYHECPNPDGFGCNICVPLNTHCPPPR